MSKKSKTQLYAAPKNPLEIKENRQLKSKMKEKIYNSNTIQKKARLTT